MEPQVKILSLCRLCGSKTQELQRVNIFDRAGVLLEVKSKIKFCLDINITEKDNLPQVICTECVNNVDNFTKFKQNAIKTKELLEGLITQQTESIKNVENSYSIKNHSIFNTTCYVSDPEEMEIKPQMVSLDQRDSNRNKKKSSNVKKKSKVKKVSHKKTNKKLNKNKPIPKIKQIIPSTFKCDFCQKVCTQRSSITKHIQYNHFITDKNLECSFCMKKFRTKNSLQIHIKNRHIREKIHVCDKCGCSFYNKVSFNYHMKAKHNPELSVKCDKCDKKFALKSLLYNHIKNVHEKDRSRWICDVCGKALANKGSLKKHKIRHEKTPEELKALRIYKCPECDVCYDHPCNLKIHMRIHTGEKLFECKICKKRFTCSSGLNVHKLTHTGERNFICDICGKAFAIKKNLDVHKYIHTGERRYQCNDCDKTYTQNSTLNIHLKKTGHTRKRV